MDNRLNGLKYILRSMLGLPGEHSNPSLATLSPPNITRD